MTDVPVSRWSDVSATLLVPLYSRALETLSPRPVLRDPKAVELMHALNAQLRHSPSRTLRRLAQGRLPRRLPLLLAMRARYFDQQASRWLARHPGGCVVSLGCGLDSRFERIDEGQGHWFELDLPGVIEARHGFFAESERRRFIPGSVLDPTWTAALAPWAGGPVLFLAEGLFMYLHAVAVRALVARLTSLFPGSTLVCELVNQWVVAQLQNPWVRWKFERDLCLGPDARFHFGVWDAHELESCAPGVRLVDEWSCFDEGEPKLSWYQHLGLVPWLRRSQWVAVYRLGRRAAPGAPPERQRPARA